MNDLNHKVLLIINVEAFLASALRAFCDELLVAGTILHVDASEAERTAMGAGILSKKIKPRRTSGVTTRVILPLGQVEHVMELLKEQIKGVVAYAVPLIAFLDEVE